MKAAEVVDRKRKREEMKMQKELNRLSRSKRTYRKRLHESSNQRNTQSIPVDSVLEIEDIRA